MPELTEQTTLILARADVARIERVLSGTPFRRSPLLRKLVQIGLKLVEQDPGHLLRPTLAEPNHPDAAETTAEETPK